MYLARRTKVSFFFFFFGKTLKTKLTSLIPERLSFSTKPPFHEKYAINYLGNYFLSCLKIKYIYKEKCTRRAIHVLIMTIFTQQKTNIFFLCRNNQYITMDTCKLC